MIINFLYNRVFFVIDFLIDFVINFLIDFVNDFLVGFLIDFVIDFLIIFQIRQKSSILNIKKSIFRSTCDVCCKTLILIYSSDNRFLIQSIF